MFSDGSSETFLLHSAEIPRDVDLLLVAVQTGGGGGGDISIISKRRL